MRHGEISRRFQPEAAAAAEARRLLVDALMLWGLEKVEPQATIVISELVNNAVLHARTPFTVTVCRPEPGLVQIDVDDADPTLPAPQEAGTSATAGRGLHMVRALATWWLAHPIRGGKRVSATFAC